MKRLLFFILVLLSADAFAVVISDVRVWNSPEHTRFVFDASSPVNYDLIPLSNPERIAIDIKKGQFIGVLPPTSKLGPNVKKIRFGVHKNKVRFVVDLRRKVEIKDFKLSPNEIYGHRLVIDIANPKAKQKKKKVRRKPKEFVVVIDAGHGGEDPGAIGHRKTYEKRLVLEVAKRLRKSLNAQPGIRAELTRKGDYYIPLRRRTQMAVDMNANLFISIHADSFTRKSAAGISVFALSQRGATSEHARLIANKENLSDLLGGVNLRNKEDVLVEVLADLSLSQQIERSIDLGSMVRTHLSKVGKLHGNGVEQAGFVVLKTPQIPSILVEIGFISNPKEEKRLNTRSYQKKLVEKITRGVVQYAEKYPWDQDRWRTAKSNASKN